MVVSISTKEEFPLNEQPRERLLHQGADALATHELLAILLRTGSKEYSVMGLALHILHEFKDLTRLRRASLTELQQIKGIGEVKAVELKAAIELGQRLVNADPIRGQTIRSVTDAGRLFIQELADEHQEKLIALYLNTKNNVIMQKTIFAGSLNNSVAHPREIFREAVKESAARIMVAHNHPSGQTTPSKADLDFTNRLVEAGQLIGIEVLDHVIVADHDFISFKQEGYL
ncbi:RadC family protein [Bavariicoccus seileri]|uniref:RadC family protein n=1 Tax=Bavariicoccus seileri TaxID=549685 RepID=UPI003F9091A7